MVVEWKVKGIFKADAETVYSEITALGDTFTPGMIVEAAKDENSELHKCFTWDDTIAAENWRNHQARMLVAQLVVRAETQDNETVAVRVISTTTTKNEYTPTTMLVKSEPDYENLLARAIRELKAFQQKYKTITELREIFEVIDEL